MKILLKVIFLFLAGWTFTSCSISYGFTGSSIDYTKVRSISIKEFPNVAPLVYAPLSQQFTEALKDKYTRQTKLQVLREGGDLDLEGEITGYNFTSLAVTDGSYASQTRLTITVRVRYTNSTNSEEDFEKPFSAQYEFNNDKTIDQVQDELGKEIMSEIIDQIFNETVANW
jgi:hypothetical protein